MWDKFKSAIFEEDPQAPANPKAGTPTVTVTSGNIAAGQAIPMGSTVNPEFVAAIKKAVFGKATALTSLVEAAEKLATIIPDQATRFKAAYATAGNGRTVQQIAAAADIHLADIEGEELRFKAAVDQRLGMEIQQLETSASSAASQIKSLQEQIASAQQRVIELTQQQGEAAAGASQKRMEQQLVSDQFKAAAQLVRNEIATLRQAVVHSLS